MTRRVPLLLLAGALVLALLAGIYASRWRASTSGVGSKPQDHASVSDMPDTTTAPKTPEPGSTPRGEVTIDPRRQQLIGVRIVPVTRELLDHALRAAGVVRYDETKQADVNVKVEGWIRELYVDATGQPIQKGQPLFTLYSPDLVNTQNEYVLALQTRDRLQQSTIPDVRQRADDLIASARQRLALWDLSADDIRTLEEKRQPLDTVVFRSPASGFVIEKQALAGLHVMPGQSLYKVADLSTVWVEADVHETDIASVRTGTPAAVTIDAYPGEQFTGRVVYVYPYFDEKTRTNKVRLELPNRGGRLKPGMYANVELTLRGGMGLVIPANALLDSGTEQVVFVSLGDGRFAPRKVKVGLRLGESTQILDGLNEGDRVATGATFFLDSESQLRASLQSYEPPASSPASTSTEARLDIAFRTVPDPPQTGDIQMEATVRDASGHPVDGAEVSVQFFMAAMPTMNMPAMRSETKLTPMAGGVYRGTGQVLMAGRWEATVTVTRNGQRLGASQLPVVVK